MRSGLLTFSAALLFATLLLLPNRPRGQSCDVASFPIACENQLGGTPQSEWDVDGAGDPALQGFSTEFSVNAGEIVRFKIDTTAPTFHIDIYRLGYYGGLGARRIHRLTSLAGRLQPPCMTDRSRALVDCGNWSESASWQIPAGAVSGIYLARLARDDTQGASHIVFVVRNDARASDVLVQTSDTTWQAYNTFGGGSLAAGNGAASYNRPFTTRGSTPEHWLFNAEYPLIRWLEAKGYSVTYASGADTERRGLAGLLHQRVFVSMGHDGYWTAAQRTNVESSRNAGVHLAFLGGSTGVWKTHWDTSIDGSFTPYRTLVNDRQTFAAQNALTGTRFSVACCTTGAAIAVPSALAGDPLWRETRVATLAPGRSALLAAGTLGGRWDEAPADAFRPPGLTVLSSTTLNAAQKFQPATGALAPGTATHAITLYRAFSGALVFSAGTTQWSWGLDGTHDRGGSIPDTAIEQATSNLLSDMSVQPSVPAQNTATQFAAAAPNGFPDGPGGTGSSRTRDRRRRVWRSLDLTDDDHHVHFQHGQQQRVAARVLYWRIFGGQPVVDHRRRPDVATRVADERAAGHRRSLARVRGVPAHERLGQGDAESVVAGVADGRDVHRRRHSPAPTAPARSARFVRPIPAPARRRRRSRRRETTRRCSASATTGIAPSRARSARIRRWSTSSCRRRAATRSGRQRVSSPIPAAGTNVTINDTSPSTDRYNLSILEILPALAADSTPPTITMSAPAPGATVSGPSVTVAASASDDIGVAGVQFTVDGANLGAEITSAPYSRLWDTTASANGNHSLAAVARDAAGHMTTAAAVGVVVANDTSPPTVTLAAPLPGAMVSGAAVTLSANASDDTGVLGVQFRVDGGNIGAEVSTPPYTLNWNSTSVPNGNHSVSGCRARCQRTPGHQHQRSSRWPTPTHPARGRHHDAGQQRDRVRQCGHSLGDRE